jgi:DNA-binding PadR family transcriptional regulator
MLPYTRKTLIRTDFFGLDSVQGLLEAAESYGDGHVVLHFRLGEVVDLVNQLVEEGYVTASWEAGSNGLQKLATLGLTIKGHEHLHVLRQRSRTGRFHKRLADLGWIILASVLTTLVTLQVRGCVGGG